jgi:hypothetical protein
MRVSMHIMVSLFSKMIKCREKWPFLALTPRNLPIPITFQDLAKSMILKLLVNGGEIFRAPLIYKNDQMSPHPYSGA